jgi:hypothetical protein
MASTYCFSRTAGSLWASATGAAASVRVDASTVMRKKAFGTVALLLGLNLAKGVFPAK